MAKKKTPEEVRAGEAKFVASCDAFKCIVKYGCVAFLGFLFFDFLKTGLFANASNLSALAQFCDHFKIGDFFWMLATLVLGTWGTVEHRSKKRLVRENGALRHQVESRDAYNSRSSLDQYGQAKED